MEFFTKVKEYFTKKSDQGLNDLDSQLHEKSGTGFATHKKQVPVPRQPVLQNAGYSCKGGVQGLDWYKASLKTDVDGDLADEFLIERSRKNDPPDKPFRVQERNVKDAALQNADLFVDHGSVLVLQDKKPT